MIVTFESYFKVSDYMWIFAILQIYLVLVVVLYEIVIWGGKVYAFARTSDNLTRLIES